MDVAVPKQLIGDLQVTCLVVGLEHQKEVGTHADRQIEPKQLLRANWCQLQGTRKISFSAEGLKRNG